MAIINGTPAADTLVGTNDDDTIIGYGGDDGINGLAGNDTITGGTGDDLIDGGAGDDTFIIESSADLAGTNDQMDGGDGTDTVVTDLAVGDNLDKADGTSVATGIVYVEGVRAFMANIEQVQVSNASDFLLTLSTDATFAFDGQTVTSADGVASGATAALFSTYTASTGLIAAAPVADETQGVVIGGVTYGVGDTFATADGGVVTVDHTNPAGIGDWTFDYTPAADALYAVGVTGDATDDVVADTVVATITDGNGDTADVTLTFTIDLDENFDASAATAGITSRGDVQTNEMVGSNFDDVIWAGPDAGTETDFLIGNAGNDILAGGGGDDIIDGDGGADILYGGAGADNLHGGGDDDVIWAGEGDDGTVATAAPAGPAAAIDTTVGVTGGNGNDIIGGGAGNDTLRGNDGDDTIYGGSDDGNDTIDGNAGNDTIYGGDGVDTLDGGDGDDLIFNGAGNDTGVNGGNGNDTLWGGAGNDTLTGGADDDTFGFIAGNGNDTIADFEFGAAAGEGDVLDLTAFGFADTQDVIDSMSDVATVATLALGPGQTVTFTGFAVSDFQAAVDDWVLV